MKCEHYACRCARARELLAIYDRTQQGRYLLMAIDVHFQQVECHVPSTTDHSTAPADPALLRGDLHRHGQRHAGGEDAGPA
jgi:hypothetical protein